MTLKNAIQPRMNTDGHGYQALAQSCQFTREVSEKRGSKSVFIRVHPWFMIVLADLTAEFRMTSYRVLKVAGN